MPVPAAIAILYAPRATLRRLLDGESPERWVLFLAAAHGLSWVLAARESLLPRELGAGALLVPAAAVVSPPLAIGLLYLHARLLRLAGGWLRGVGELAELRAAIAWSAMPVLFARLTALPLLITGVVERTAEHGGGEVPFPAPMAFLCDLSRLADSSPIGAIAELWSLLLLLLCVAEAQRFSGWRALVNDLLARWVGVAALALALLLGWRLSLLLA